MKKDRNSHCRNKNYNLLKRKLEDLEFENGVKEFEDKLIGGTK
ncbi:hypothetical protein [Cetobacterium sp.]